MPQICHFTANILQSVGLLKFNGTFNTGHIMPLE